MFNIETLKPLRPFSWQHTPLRAIDRSFFAYYGIDFTEQFEQSLQHHFGVMPLAGYDIAVHYFHLTSNQKTVVLVHGYFDHVGLYGHLIKALLSMGYNVLAYDLPGHGLSSGEQAGIPDFADYQAVLAGLLAAARPHIQTPLYLIGQSTGCSIAMDYVMNNPAHEFDKMILLAPLVRPKHWTYLCFVLFTAGRFMRSWPRDFHANSHNTEFLAFLKNNDPLQTRTIKTSWAKALYKWQAHFLASPPSSLTTLVIQGDEDGTVEWRYNLEQIAKKFTQLKVAMIAGAMHHMINESELYLALIFDDIKSFLEQD